MTTAALFVEAVDTALALWHAVVGWMICLAAIGSILVIAAVACGVWGWTGVTGAQDGAEDGAEVSGGAPEPDEAPEPAQRRTRPSWACEQPTTYDDLEEAA
ncbi:hypothetical protein [Streptomyces prunicolor]